MCHATTRTLNIQTSLSNSFLLIRHWNCSHSIKESLRISSVIIVSIRNFVILLNSQWVCLGQQLVKHVISRCAVASSSDDIIITALDAVHWTKTGWQAVTESTIRNTFRAAAFIHPDAEETSIDTTNSIDDFDEENTSDDISLALKISMHSSLMLILVDKVSVPVNLSR